MGNYCIVVASGLHARCFTLEPVELPELESGPKLIERGELFNPEKEIARRDLYTDSGMSPAVLKEELTDLREITMIYEDNTAQRLISRRSSVQQKLWDLFQLGIWEKRLTYTNG